LRACLRETRVINRNNTIISNVLKCRPPNNKFPTDDTPRTCFSKWLSSEIEVLAPKRMLLLGAQALKFVAGMKGITSVRGNWMRARGIRMMATFHPSYVLRQEGEGDPTALASFKGDIANVAAEVAELEREG
jgi:DNA polymerase